MTDNELIQTMKGIDEKYKSMKKLAMKVAREMDSLVEQYTPLLEEAKNRRLILRDNE